MAARKNIVCYILECEQNKFYTGSTVRWKLQARFEAHRDGNGSKWCKQFRPIRVLKVIQNLTSPEGFTQENIECRRIMIENNDLQCCRGGDILFPLGSDWWVSRHNVLTEHFTT